MKTLFYHYLIGDTNLYSINICFKNFPTVKKLALLFLILSYDFSYLTGQVLHYAKLRVRNMIFFLPSEGKQ